MFSYNVGYYRLNSQGYAEEPAKTDEAEPYGQASKASG
jgi:hypothetical protein